MIFAVSLFVLVLSFLLGNNNSEEWNRARYIVIISFILIIVSGLRHFGVGNDTYSYILEFQSYANYSYDDLLSNFTDYYLHPGENGNGKDPGFAILCSLLTSISTEPLFFEFTIAAFLLSSLARFFYVYITSMKGLTLAYIYYITSFYIYLPNSSARQSLALGFLLIGFVMLRKSKGSLLFCIFCVLASFFHKSSLIALVVLPVYYLVNLKLLYCVSVFAFPIILTFNRQVGIYLTSFSDIYSVYGTSDFYERGTKPFMYLLFATFVYLIGHYVLKKSKYVVANKLSYIGLALAFVLSPISLVDPSLMRVISYFGVWTCVAMNDFATNENVNRQTLFYLLLATFLLRAFVNPGTYAFVWDDFALPTRY